MWQFGMEVRRDRYIPTARLAEFIPPTRLVPTRVPQLAYPSRNSPAPSHPARNPSDSDHGYMSTKNQKLRTDKSIRETNGSFAHVIAYASGCSSRLRYMSKTSVCFTYPFRSILSNFSVHVSGASVRSQTGPSISWAEKIPSAGWGRWNLHTCRRN